MTFAVVMNSGNPAQAKKLVCLIPGMNNAGLSIKMVDGKAVRVQTFGGSNPRHSHLQSEGSGVYKTPGGLRLSLSPGGAQLTYNDGRSFHYNCGLR